MSELVDLTDEFMEVATKEINEELTCINKILSFCKNDSDVSENSRKIERHVHNIKGLAPMMEKEICGKVAKHLDSNLKKIISGEKIEGIFVLLCTSVEKMKKDMDNHYEKSEIQG